MCFAPPKTKLAFVAIEPDAFWPRDGTSSLYVIPEIGGWAYRKKKHTVTRTSCWLEMNLMTK